MTGEVVVDASVILKWVFPAAPDEADVEPALSLLSDIRAGGLTAVQPPHWLAEVGAVIVRRFPARATEVIGLLYGWTCPCWTASRCTSGPPGWRRIPGSICSILFITPSPCRGRAHRW